MHFLYHRSTTHIGPTCYLQDLFTLDSERGKGIGRALIEAVYDAARAHRAERVYWQTHETNHTAMRLYDTVAENGRNCLQKDAAALSTVSRVFIPRSFDALATRHVRETGGHVVPTPR